MELQANDALGEGLGMLIGDVDGSDPVDLVEESVSDGDDAQSVPFPVHQLGLVADLADDFGSSVRTDFDALATLGDDAALAELLSVEHAKVVLRGVQISLVAFEDEVRLVDDPAAVLKARVVALETHLGGDLEVRDLAALPDEEGVALRRIFRGRLADDDAILHRPELRQTFPTGQVLAVEKGFLGLDRSDQGKETEEEKREFAMHGRFLHQNRGFVQCASVGRNCIPPSRGKRSDGRISNPPHICWDRA